MTEVTAVAARIPTVLEDPSQLAVARVYAQAFLDAAKSVEQGSLEEFASFVEDVLGKSPEFERILYSRVISSEDKLGVINRVLAGRGSDLFVNFLRVLVRHDRLELMPSILRIAGREWERRLGKRRVQVRTARPLNEEQQGAIQERLRGSFPFEPILEPVVDTSLLGGIVIQIGDTVYDSSLRTRMKQLRSRMRQRSLHEIQSGRDRFSSPEGN